MDLSAPLSISPTLTVDQTLEIMDKEGYDQLPVIDETGYVYYRKNVKVVWSSSLQALYCIESR